MEDQNKTQEILEQSAGSDAVESAITSQAPQEATKKPHNTKRIITIVAAVAVLLLAFAIGAEFAENRIERKARQMQGQILTQQAQNTNMALISQDEATTIALNAAGINPSDAQWISAYLDSNHGFYQYDVNFVSGTYEYDFEIDATNGIIMESDIDSVFD